jgi:hypothetical protein
VNVAGRNASDGNRISGLVERVWAWVDSGEAGITSIKRAPFISN